MAITEKRLSKATQPLQLGSIGVAYQADVEEHMAHRERRKEAEQGDLLASILCARCRLEHADQYTYTNTGTCERNNFSSCFLWFGSPSQMKSDTKPWPEPWLTTRGRTRACAVGDAHRNAVPRGPASHLWQLAM